MKVPLRVMTLNFELLTEIDQYESLQITRSWHGIGNIELRVNRYMRDVDKLQRGNIIFPHNKTNKAYIIRHKEIELDENGKASENWIIRALPLKSWIAQRITYPPSHTAYDNKSDNAESVILHYINNNVINPTDSKRKINNLVLEANENRGTNINWQSRFKNLAEEIAEISLLSGLGWNIDIDLDNQQFVFKVSEGRDLSVNQSTLPPVIFSPEFNTLGEMSYVESDLNYRDVAIVAGQGEGVDRRIVEVGNSEGHERYELFVDARDIEEVDDDENPIPVPIIEQNLIERGLQKLKEHEQEVYLEGQALMSRVKRRIPTEINGTLSDSTITNEELETLFLQAFQPVESTVSVKRDFTIDLLKLGNYRSSIFNWIENTPQGTSVKIYYSTDNVVWHRLYNGQGIEYEGTLKRLYIRYELLTINHDVVPSISNFSYEIKGEQEREFVSTAKMIYEHDYDLGDIVTLQNKDWNVTLDTRITEVKEIYEAGNHMRIEFTFNNSRPTLISKIKQELSMMQTEMVR